MAFLAGGEGTLAFRIVFDTHRLFVTALFNSMPSLVYIIFTIFGGDCDFADRLCDTYYF